MRTAHLGLSVALLAVSCLGCQSPTPTDAGTVATDVVGGRRLKAQWVGGPDGPVAPAPWVAAFHDLVLDAPCDFGLASDGVLRCLVGYRRSAVLLGGLGAGVLYADPGCTTEVMDRSPLCEAPSRWVPDPRATTCPPTVRIRKPGVKLEPGAPIYQRSGADCVVAASPAGDEHWTLVDEDPAIFAAASYQDGPSADGFTVQRIVSEDGASQAIGLRPDGERWVGVPTVAADGVTRLLPAGPEVWATGGFADPECTSPAMYGSGCPAAGELGTTWRALDACRSGKAIYRLGERLEVQHAGASCVATPVGAGEVFSAVEVPAASLPEVLQEAPTTRLQQATYRVGPRWRWRQGAVIDATLGEEVGAATTEDGVRRWLPAWSPWFAPTQGAAETWAFADPACTARLLAYPSGLCVTPGAWAKAQALLACGGPAVMWRTGPWSGPELHTRTGPGGPCVASPPDPARRYLRLVAPAAPETFAPATELLR